MPAYKKHIAERKVCMDCIGMIKGSFWTNGGTSKGVFLYNFLLPTRIAGGFLFRFAQLPKGINKKPRPSGIHRLDAVFMRISALLRYEKRY